MSTTKFLFLTFTIICVFQRMQVQARRGSYVGNWKNSHRKTVAYMGCDIKDRFFYNSEFLKPKCNITVEAPNSHGTVDRLFCNIDRPAFTNLKNLHYEISAAINANVVLLYGTGRSWAKIRIVRMRECRYRDVKIDVDPLNYDDFGTVEINVTLSDDTFDVFYEDRNQCPSGVCLATYDFSGRLLEDPFKVDRPTNDLIKNKVTYVFGEQYSGNVSFIYDSESIKLALYRQQNASDVLFELPRQNVTVLSISTQKRLFALCYKWNYYRKAGCLQYDNQGKQIVNATFFFSKSWSSLRVTNRYEGGFSAMATNCTIKECIAQRDIYQLEISDKKVKYAKPMGYIPRVCRSRVGNKAEIEIGFDYATYLNCKPSLRGHHYTFMFKSWCSEFIKCSPVI